MMEFEEQVDKLQGATCILADYLVSAESLHAYANLHATIRQGEVSY